MTDQSYNDFCLPDDEESSSSEENSLLQQAFFSEPATVIDLCDEDDDDDAGGGRDYNRSSNGNQYGSSKQNHHPTPQSRQSKSHEHLHFDGLRNSERSPRFNQVERGIENWQNEKENTNEDVNERNHEVIECWSSDEEAKCSKRVARLPKRRSQRRIRNAANASHASSVPELHQASENVYYRQGTNHDTPDYINGRRDIFGGVGLPGCNVYQSASHQSGSQQSNHRRSPMEGLARPASWSNPAPTKKGDKKKKAAAPKKKKWTGKKKGNWGRKGNYYNRKKGQSSYSNNRRRTNSNQPYMNIAKQDPQLRHVGGAKITF